ncbi:MAG: superoxide dismutase [Magnetococcales bacterium]|nr:superoxide dismutase [Magnetococcales bacterium]
MYEYIVHEDLMPTGLEGISDDQIQDHWGLYKGYVAQCNILHKELEEMRHAGKGGTPAYADRRRRFGFEYAGMTLHEYYFGNLKAGTELKGGTHFCRAVTAEFGSKKDWLEDFSNTGKTRGIGWAICYLDPATGQINNHFVQLHEDGNIPGFVPLLVMDVFEHAYMVDHKALGRPKYIEAFLRNVNWDIVEKRYSEAIHGKEFHRFAA